MSRKRKFVAKPIRVPGKGTVDMWLPVEQPAKFIRVPRRMRARVQMRRSFWHHFWQRFPGKNPRDDYGKMTVKDLGHVVVFWDCRPYHSASKDAMKALGRGFVWGERAAKLIALAAEARGLDAAVFRRGHQVYRHYLSDALERRPIDGDGDGRDAWRSGDFLAVFLDGKGPNNIERAEFNDGLRVVGKLKGALENEGSGASHGPTHHQTATPDDAEALRIAFEQTAPPVTKPGEPTGAKGATSAKGVTWQDAQGKLMRMLENDDPCPTIRTLAADLRCAKSTVQKAIDNSPTLRRWRDQHVPKSPKVQSLNPIVTDNVQSKIAGPVENVIENDQLDTVFARLLQDATPEQRAVWNGYDTEKKRELARTTLEQQDEQAIQESGPERTDLAYSNPKRRGNRLLGRKP